MDGEPNTIEAIENFHATRMEWMYTNQKELVDKIRDAGIQSVNLAIWAPEENEGGQGNEIRTCVINDNGEEVTIPILPGRNWGCANNECHLEYIKYLVKRCIDAGADTIQFDNYRLNLFVKENLEDSDKKICYCYFCQRDAELLGKSPDEIQDEFVVREFYDKLQMYTNEYIKDIDRFKNNNITQFRFSCNNYNVVWKHFNLEHRLFFIGMSEISSLSGETIYSYTFDVNESGWLMIGGCTESGTKVSVDNGIIVVIYGYIQGAGYQRVTGETLESGQGYWILVNDIGEKAKLTVK